MTKNMQVNADNTDVVRSPPKRGMDAAHKSGRKDKARRALIVRYCLNIIPGKFTYKKESAAKSHIEQPPPKCLR